MKTQELTKKGFPKSVTKLLEERGIKELNPVQKKALSTKFLENNANLVVATPTASGKTLIAELAALNAMNQGKKVLYTCPLRALASEHYQTFKSYVKAGYNVALSSGDYDSSDPWLNKYDWVITTNEKADSLIRHRSKFIPNVGLLVVDEIHLLDSDRGPTLEMLITRFKQLFPKTQIVALSATAPNAAEIAEWLEAELVESQWRPTKLVQGVYHEGVIQSTEGKISLERKSGTPVDELVQDVLGKDGETLVFVNNRRSAEAVAEHLKKYTKRHCDTKTLGKLSEKVLNALETPTKQCRRLAACVKGGSAFHHAGLVQAQRKLVEDAFREEKIKVIAATPTLAMGVNTPADVVVVRDVTRYTVGGMVNIPVREYHQLAGRAGRPNYGKDGLAVITARDEVQQEDYFDKYVCGEPEQVSSQLGLEPVLRSQLLASISLHFTPTMEKLEEFLMHSFYAHSFGEVDSIKSQSRRILSQLEEMGFIEVGDKLTATALGTRVSELYIDPLSAFSLLQGMDRRPGEIGLLYLICGTEELKPFLRVKRSEESDLWVSANSREKELGIDTVNIGFQENDFLEKYKTSLLLSDWVNEKTEEQVLEDYGIAPGILRSRVSRAEWIAYAGAELARITKKSSKEFKHMQRRIKYGVKQELLPLVELRGIGRVRARRLFNSSIRSVRDLEKTDFSDLTRVLGPKTARKVKKQLGQEVPQETGKKAPQATLTKD
jgi:helicase